MDEENTHLAGVANTAEAHAMDAEVMKQSLEIDLKTRYD